MSNMSINIRFIRTNGSPKNDDKVIISRLPYSQDNRFNLSYTYGDTNVKTPHQVVLAPDAVFRWMRNIIGLLEKDSDPFESVQLDLPFMPSVLFDVPKLSDAYHPLLDAIEFHLDNWPATTFLPPSPIEEEEEEYDDMPPLIPLRTNTTNSRHHLFLDEDY